MLWYIHTLRGLDLWSSEMDTLIGEKLNNQSKLVFAQAVDFAEIGLEFGLKLATVVVLLEADIICPR